MDVASHGRLDGKFSSAEGICFKHSIIVLLIHKLSF